MENRQRGRLWALISICALALISVACFIYPLYVIQPFRAQGARELAVALAILLHGQVVSFLCAIAASLFAIWQWPKWRLVGRIVSVAAAVGACAGTALTHVNIYEHMFHPDSSPSFEPGSEAKIDPTDMVMTVKVNGVSRAYPIREMGYHHIVNDEIDGVAIAATY